MSFLAAVSSFKWSSLQTKTMKKLKLFSTDSDTFSQLLVSSYLIVRIVSVALWVFFNKLLSGKFCNAAPSHQWVELHPSEGQSALDRRSHTWKLFKDVSREACRCIADTFLRSSMRNIWTSGSYSQWERKTRDEGGTRGGVSPRGLKATDAFSDNRDSGWLMWSDLLVTSVIRRKAHGCRLIFFFLKMLFWWWEDLFKCFCKSRSR